MITLAIIIALSFVLLFGASVRRRISGKGTAVCLTSCNHCGKWINPSGGAEFAGFGLRSVKCAPHQ